MFKYKHQKIAHHVIKQYERSKKINDIVCGLHIMLSNNMNGVE